MRRIFGGPGSGTDVQIHLAVVTVYLRIEKIRDDCLARRGHVFSVDEQIVLLLDGGHEHGGVAFLEKNLKQSRTVIMKDTGHRPMLERPEETAKAYESFLREKR